MSPTCDSCFGLIADESGIIKYLGNVPPALCYCQPVAEAADLRAQHDLDAKRIEHLEAQLDVCAVAAVEAIHVITYLQGEIERLELVITSINTGARGRN